LRLLCDANPMAYGASSALLAMLDHLDADVTAVARGVSQEVLGREGRIHRILDVDPKNPADVAAQVRSGDYDAVLVVSNKTNLDHYFTINLPVFFVDILAWYGARKVIAGEVQQFFHERFPHHPSIRRTEPADGSLSRSVEVGPLVRTAFLAQGNAKQGTLANIGGAANPWIRPGENSNYLPLVLELVGELRDTLPEGPVLIAGGAAAIDSVPVQTRPPWAHLATLPQTDYLAALGHSSLFITAPGLNAVFEAILVDAPLAFLPPQNASQVEQLYHYEAWGLVAPGLNLSDLVDGVPPPNAGVPESEMTACVLTGLEQLARSPEARSQAVAHMRRQIAEVNGPVRRAAKAAFKAALGPPGGDAVACAITKWWKQRQEAPTILDLAVILTTKGDRPELLDRAVTSVLHQCRPPRELRIVVDADVSVTEKTTSRLAARTRPGIAPLMVIMGLGPSGHGASAARNAGARAVTTRHLAFLDDDDCWKPRYLEAVFEGGPGFDIALTAFEKHGCFGVTPEKVPPVNLSPWQFLVGNPGIRGSNLVIARELFMALGGFAEDLPALNDVDLGLRLARRGPLRYRRVVEPNVEFHAHQGPRLSTPGCRANREGLERFLLRHAPDMSSIEEAAFRRRAVRLWSVDPWDLAVLHQRLCTTRRSGDFTSHFRSLLHAAETVLLEQRWGNPAGQQAALAESLVAEICASFESEAQRPMPPRLTIGVTTTDSPHGVAVLIESLLRELDISRWAAQALGHAPISLVVVENAADPAVREAHRDALGRVRDRRLQIHHITWEEKGQAQTAPSWSIGQSRAFLHSKLSGRGCSRDAPVWIIDEDLEFDGLGPSPNRGWGRQRTGSTLHRLECLVRSVEAEALVGGNTGAAPVPALFLMRRQLEDLVTLQDASEDDVARSAAETTLPGDAYYDLSQTTEDGKRQAPPPQWWEPGPSQSSTWQSDDVVEDALWRLLAGQPATRPLVFRVDPETGSAWGGMKPATVAGGNTVCCTDALLRPDWFIEVRWHGGRSRRADSAWSTMATHHGYRVIEVTLPLLHERPSVPRISAQHLASQLMSAALCDAAGAAMYQTLREVGAPDANGSWRETWQTKFSARLADIDAARSAGATALTFLRTRRPRLGARPRGRTAIEALEIALATPLPEIESHDVDLVAAATSVETGAGRST